MNENIVVVDSISKVYKKKKFIRSEFKKAIDCVSFSIKRGEILGLLGLNGAGKTTIIKLICGIISLTSGNIKIFGEDVGGINIKRRIGYLPELPYFYPYMTPLDSLIYYGSLSGMKNSLIKESATKILCKVGLEKNINTKNSEFSKGMLQRLGIAQILLHNPDLLIMDEPVSGLDPIAIKDIRNLMIELNNEGKTIFLSSHSISELEKVCHRVIILNNGRIHSIINKDNWQNSSNSLEDIFVRAVS